MDYSQWFKHQLQASADGFAWGARQVPETRRDARPPATLGEWTAARHVFHLLYYEDRFALPSMRQWRGDASPALAGANEDAAWAEAVHDFDRLLTDFRHGRSTQVALLDELDSSAWETMQQTIWGPRDLLWVTSKTYQHTAEHTHTVMSMALFWDRHEAMARRQAGNQG